MLDRILIPRHVRAGIRSNHYGFELESFQLFGGDTETVNGRPYTLQLHDGQETALLWVDVDNVLDVFINYFRKRLQSRVNVVYFHNLSYDLVVLCYKYAEEFAKHPNRAILKGPGWQLAIWYGKRWWARLQIGSRRLLILDSWAFVFCSLETIAKQLKLSVPKAVKPDGLGAIPLTSSEFIEYAKRDAVLAYEVGQWIIQQHKEYNVRLCVSLPQFAARVLRHDFFRDTEVLSLPSASVCASAVLSYHGGKNGCYAKSGWHKNLQEADLTSAYAWAMTEIPQMISGRYAPTRSLRSIYEPGIYEISGRMRRCKYPILFAHDFSPLDGAFRDVWVTSYELHEALACKEVSIDRLRGHVWQPERGYRHNPIADFNREFFAKKKASESTDPRRVLYKLLCNSLAGKFIQHMPSIAEVEVLRENAKTFQVVRGEYIAGGLFHPFLGTLITGYVRARMHQLEKEYDSLHTATDSIKTRSAVTETDGLGGLRIIARGDCLILRNKLYIHFDSEGRVAKVGLHGFHGTPDQLLAMVRNHTSTYRITHLRSLKEALRSHQAPLEPVTQDLKLHLDTWP